MADDYQIEIIQGPAHSYSRWLQAEMKKTDIMPGHCRTINRINKVITISEGTKKEEKWEEDHITEP